MANPADYGLSLPPDSTPVYRTAEIIRTNTTQVAKALADNESTALAAEESAKRAADEARAAAALVGSPAGETILASVRGAGPVRGEIERIADSAVSAAAQQGDFGYLVATFLANGPAGEKLSLFYSPDGKTIFGGAGNPAYTPTDGQGVRDPSILRHNGRWYVAHTSNNGLDKDFKIAASDTAAPGTWSQIASISGSSVPGMTKLWAPQLVTDEAGAVYVFYSSINASNVGEMYWIRATNAALTAWTAPTKVAWNGTAPAHYIDATYIRRDGRWYMFYSTGPAIERATADTLTGPYTRDKFGNWAGWGTGIEGPEIVEDTPGRYRIYFDRFQAGTGYAYSESSDLNTWTAPAAVAAAPNVLAADQRIRHGSFYKLSNQIAGNQIMAMTLPAERSRHIEFAAASGFTIRKNAVTTITQLAIDGNETTDPDLASYNAATGTFTLNVMGSYSITLTTGTTGVTGVNRTFSEMAGTDGVTTHMRASGGPEDIWSLSMPNFKPRAAGEQFRLRNYANWSGSETTATCPTRVRIELNNLI